MNEEAIRLFNEELNKVENLDINDVSNHFEIVKALCILSLQLDGFCEIIPMDEKIGVFKMMQVFNKYFTQSEKYNKKFTKGIKCPELKEQFKKLVEVFCSSLKERRDFHDNFIHVPKNIKFIEYLKLYKSQLLRFIESNSINNRINSKDILNKAANIIKSKFNDNIYVGNEDDLDDEEEYIDEYYPDPIEFDSLLVSSLINRLNEVAKNDSALPNFDQFENGAQIPIDQLAYIMYNRITESYEANKNHLDSENALKRLSLKSSFKEHSSSALFLYSILDIIAITMHELQREFEMEDGSDDYLPIIHFKLGLIYDLIVLHLTNLDKKE